MENNQQKAPKTFSENTLWRKLGRYAKTAGREVVETVLQLFYALQDSDTPVWARGVIIGALLYFISPIDAIPDFLPGGYVDDLATMVAALRAIAGHIKESHRQKARKVSEKWFGKESNEV